MAGQYSADCKAKRISGMVKFQRRLKLLSLKLPRRFAHTYGKCRQAFVGISHLELHERWHLPPSGEPRRQNSCEFACVCVLARGFATGGTVIPMY